MPGAQILKPEGITGRQAVVHVRGLFLSARRFGRQEPPAQPARFSGAGHRRRRHLGRRADDDQQQQPPALTVFSRKGSWAKGPPRRASCRKIRIFRGVACIGRLRHQLKTRVAGRCRGGFALPLGSNDVQRVLELP
jgi:hypothetical protein